MRERRYKKARTPRRVFLVICEGETEKTYVEALKQHFRLPITIKTRISGNAINNRLITQYLTELGLDKNDISNVFKIYDADDDVIVRKLMELPGATILTNPCIEFWYLIHCMEWSRQLISGNAVRELKSSHTVWNNYSKGCLHVTQKEFLLNHYREASERAKKLQWYHNPSSNMHLFIEALEIEKKNGETTRKRS